MNDRADGAVAQSVNVALRFLTVLMVFGCIGWLGSGMTQVQPGSTAVVLRFGRIVREHRPGLLLALPRPLEEVVVVPGPEQPLTYTSERFNLGGESGPLLTGDAGVVHVRGTVVYTVSSPRDFALMRDRVPAALERLFSAAVVEACATRSLDGVMVARVESTDLADARASDESAAAREHLRSDLANAIDHAAHTIALGISISRVDLVSELPLKAQSAFANVSTAESTAATEIATARTLSERQHQDAAVQAERIRNDAQAHGRELVTRARVDTNAIAALEAESDPQRRSLLFTRLYRERVDSILRRCGGITTLAADGHLPVAIPVR